MAETNTEVDEFCSRCLMTMIPHNYLMCRNQHKYCEDCHVEYRTCLLCLPRGSKVTYFCRWNMPDCGQFSSDKIRVHEFICPFRKYECPFCLFSTVLKEMGHHFTTEHPFTEFFRSNFYQSNQKVDRTWCMVMYRELFLCEVTIKSNAVRWSVSVISSWYLRVFKNIVVYLDLCGTRQMIPICDRAPCFVLELPDTKLPPDDEFAYCVTVLQTKDWGLN